MHSHVHISAVWGIQLAICFLWEKEQIKKIVGNRIPQNSPWMGDLCAQKRNKGFTLTINQIYKFIVFVWIIIDAFWKAEDLKIF